MIDGVEDVFFQIDVIHLIVLQNNVFADTLHRKQLVQLLVLHQIHLAERALADQLHHLEVFQVRRSLVSAEHLVCAHGHMLFYLLVVIWRGRLTTQLVASQVLLFRVVSQSVLIFFRDHSSSCTFNLKKVF